MKVWPLRHKYMVSLHDASGKELAYSGYARVPLDNVRVEGTDIVGVATFPVCIGGNCVAESFGIHRQVDRTCIVVGNFDYAHPIVPGVVTSVNVRISE